MLTQITVFLIETVFGFFVCLLLARFHFQWLRVPFHNPVGQFVLAMTSWLVMPVRRVIPGLAGLDLPTLLVAWLVQALSITLQVMAVGGAPHAAPVLAVAVVDLVRFSLYILICAVIVQAVMSWFRAESPFAPAINALTRPFLRPLRRRVPLAGGFDLSPLILLVLLQVILIVLAYVRVLAGQVG